MGCGGSKTDDGTNAGQQKTAATNQNRTTNNNTAKTNTTKTNTGNQHPQSKYATSSNGEPFKEANDKGYKKRIRTALIQATKSKDIDELETAIHKFEINHMEDCGDLTRANERLGYLKMKRDLRDAIRRNHIGILERTIADAKASQYAGQLQREIAAAERKLEHRRELNKYSHDILEMDQFTISELHSYHRPPACVHDVMAASYMLLGHDESTLRDWSYLQSMAGRVGRDSLMHQVRDFDSANVPPPTGKRVREILSFHELDEVRVASNGAAAFHVWASNVVDKIDKDKAQEEEERQQAQQQQQGGNNAKTKGTPAKAGATPKKKG